jgi:hypothetical protein
MAGVDQEIEAYVSRARQALEVARGNLEGRSETLTNK